MILKIFVVFLTVFNLQTNITTFCNVINLGEINSIIEYIKNIELKTLNDYNSNSSLINKTSYEVLKLIFNDGRNVLNDFEEVSKNSNFDTFDSKWDDFIELLSFHETNPHNSSETYAFLNMNYKVRNYDEKIGLLIDTFKYIIEDDSDNIDDFCQGVFKTSRHILNYFNYENYANEYLNIIQAVRKSTDSLLTNNEKLTKSNGCGKFTSFRQLLFNYYKRMLFAQVKYSIVNYYMWIIEQQCDNSSYRGSINKARTYSMKLQDIMNSTVKTLHGINYYAYQCDPEVHERSSENTYIELKRMIQTIIINEKNLTSTQSCNNGCNLELIANSISNETECQEFLDCEEMSSYYNVCEMDNNVRRYEWFEDSYGHIYGNKNGDTCHGNVKLLSSYFEGPFFHNCAYCVCACKSKRKSAPNVITSISFRDQVSDIIDNKIVTGARFVERAGMIHIQILQAEVLPHGKTINPTWKPVENFDYNETTKNYYIINDKSPIELRSGIDYGEAEIMNLNDVMCSKGQVVTGVRIRFARDSLDTSNLTKGAMELQIQTTRLDFNTGKLMVDIDEPHWITPKNQSINEFVLRNRGNPRNSPKTDFVLTTNKSVKFYRSDLKKDAGQTTVPFFDSREVLFDEGFPLGGIGLFHYGDEESAGYLALRVFDFDMF